MLDGRGQYLLPGLIDCHVHLILDAEPDIVAYVSNRDPDDDVAVAARNAAAAVRAGFTTLRDMGCARFAVPTLRDLPGDATDRASAQDLSTRPGLVACGHMITAAKGHVLDISREVDGADDAPAAVTEQAAGGADFVKLIISGGLLTPGTTPQKREMAAALTAAVGEAARAAGLALAVHAYDDGLVLEALAAGARTIEHGSWLNSGVLRAASDAGAFLVPTLAAPWAILQHPDQLADHAVANAEATWNAAQEMIPRAQEAGVAIAVGTDAGTPFNRHGDNAAELQLLSRCGMSPAEVIAAATTVGADLLDRPDLGRIEPGAAADLILLDHDPRTNLTTLNAPRAVVHAGALVQLSRHLG